MAIGSRRQAEIARLESQLATLRTQIAAAEGGAASLDGISFTPASVSSLHSECARIERRIETLSGYRPTSMAVDFSGVGQ